MQAMTTIGLDIAKSVFQVHGIDAEGNVLIRRQLKRRYLMRTASTGRTHGCTDQCCKREESPCQHGAVHTWHIAVVGGLPSNVRL